jgi:3-methyladenine DNA glycosylase AlkD
MEEQFIYTDYQSFLDYLNLNKETSFAEFQRKLIPNEKILGVRTPKLRLIAKLIARSNWQKFLYEVKGDTLEEVIIHGLVICNLKLSYIDSIELIKDFVPNIKSWASCDICSSSFKFFKDDQALSFSFLKSCLSSDDQFSVRFGIIVLMDFFINDQYISKLFPLFDDIKNDGFYVKMAIAWAISNCFIKYPEVTMKYLKADKLDDWTYNKALQKIVESRRIDDKTKDIVRSMKRKSIR